MVTKEELDSAQQENEQALVRPVPVRRFGAGRDVREEQKQVLIQREQAKRNLSLIQQERDTLLAQETERAKQETIQKVYRQIQRKAEGKGGSILDTKEERELYNQILKDNPSLQEAVQQGTQARSEALGAGYGQGNRSGNRFVTEYQRDQNRLAELQLQDLEAQGLQPVIRNGKVVGFEDELGLQSVSVDSLPEPVARRLNKAGIQTQVVSSQETVTEQESPTQNEAQSQSRLLQSYTQANKDISSRLVKIGVSDTNIKKASTFLAKLNPVSYFSKSTETFIQSAFSSALTDIRDKPFKYGALVGTGAIFRAGIEGFNVFKTTYPVVGKIIGTGVTAGGIGYGAFTLNKLSGTATGYKFVPTNLNNKTVLKFTKVAQVTAIESGAVIGVTATEIGAFTLGTIPVKYLATEVKIKVDRAVEPRFTVKTTIKDMRKNNQLLTIAQLEVVGKRPQRQAFFVKRYDLFLQSPAKPFIKEGSKSYQDISFPTLQKFFTRGRLVTIEKKKVGVSVSEPFITRNGRIIKSLNTNNPFVFVGTQLTTGTRRGKVTFSRIQGTVDTAIGDINFLNRKTLDKNSLKSLEKLETLVPSGSKKVRTKISNDEFTFILERAGKATTIKFPRGTNLFSGNVKLENLFTITGKNNKKTLIPFGRRTSTGTLVGVQRTIRSDEYEKEFGLIGKDIFAERIGFVDTTFPRLRKPRKGYLLQGVVEREEYNLPSDTIESFGVIPKRVLTPAQRKARQLSRLETSKVTQSVATAQALKLSQSLRPRTTAVPTSLSKTGATIFSRGAYTGLGLYERTEAVSAVNPRTLTSTSTNTFTLTGQPSIGSYRELNKNISKTITKDITKQSPAFITKLLPKEISKTTTKNTAKLITKTTPKTTSTNLLKIPSTQSRSTSTRTPYLSFGLKRTKGKKARGSIGVALRRFGTFRTIATGLTASQASIFGREKANTSLGRTVRFFGNKRELSQLNIDSAFFRKPVGRSKLNAPFTFIERGKFALSTGSEKASIQKARRLGSFI